MFKKGAKKLSDKPPIRVGLIGSAFMGFAHSNAYKNVSNFYDLPCRVDMKAVCSLEPKDKLEAFAEKMGWESVETDWRQLIARNDIDYIDVSTPGYLHKPMVLEAIKNGKHVLCEKPLANTLADANEMLEAAEKAGIRHCCGFSYRSTPSQALAKLLVDQGKLGRIFHIYARYAQDWIVDPNYPMTWRLQKELAGSGALGDIGAHSIDATRFITGLKFKEVIGNMQTFVHKRPLDGDKIDGEKGKVTVDDVTQFLVNFEEGATGCYEATRFATGRKNNNTIEINGEKGTIVWNFEEQNYLYFLDKTKPIIEQGFAKIQTTHDEHPHSGGWWPEGHGIGYGDAFIVEVAEFMTAIMGKKPYAPDFNDGVECQKILDAIEKSVNERKWIRLG